MTNKTFFLNDGSINMRAAEQAARQSRGALVRDGLRIFRRKPAGAAEMRR